MMPRSKGDSSEDGAILVLAMIVLLAIGVVSLALVQFAVSSSSTTIAVRSQTVQEMTAENAVTAAIQAVRVSYTYPGESSGQDPTTYGTTTTPGPTLPCLPSGVISSSTLPSGWTSSIDVYCSGYAAPGTANTRTVLFYACTTGLACGPTAPRTNAILLATVVYDDIPIGQSANAGVCYYTTSGHSNASCGISMTIAQWDVRTADS